MLENFNYIPETENRQERLDTNQINLFFTDVEGNIRKNYETNSTILGADSLTLKQYQTLQETNQSKESKETQIQQETKEQLDKEAFKNEMKIFLYEKLGIDNNLENNSSIENFIKGVIDGGVLDNYDLLIQIYETNGKIILDGIKELLTWEGLKKLAESLKQDLWTLWDGNAYEKGKVSAEVVLGLITAGAGVTVNVLKKGVKEGVKLTTKQIAKLRVNKEKLVENSEVKQVIGETKNRVDEVVPRQEVDLEKEILAKLPENIRSLDLELENYSPKQLEGIKQRLGLNSKATLDEIDLSYRLKLKEVLDRYKELSKVNLARFGREILEELRKSGDINPLQTLENEILKLELMKDKGELLIISVIPKKIKEKGTQLNKFASIDEKGISRLREGNYIKIRESTESGIGSYGLDPKYASFLISKGQLNDIRIYGGDKPRFIGYTIEELEGRAGVTLYDSMLSGIIGKSGDMKQMLEYTTETLIKAKAIYNIDERLGFPIHNRLKQEAINVNNGKMKRFFEGVKPYVEVHIFGGNSQKVKEALTEKDFIEKYFNK